MNIGGSAEPAAFTEQQRVTRDPLSADVKFPTCLTPVPATIFPDLWTVVIPVLSQL